MMPYPFALLRHVLRSRKSSLHASWSPWTNSTSGTSSNLFPLLHIVELVATFLRTPKISFVFARITRPERV